MPEKSYRVRLSKEERKDLEAWVSKGKGSARRLRRARILLLADEGQEAGGWKDSDIAEALSASVRTVERTRQNCVEQGSEAALNHRRPHKGRSKVLDGKAEAYLIQLACTEAAHGPECWTAQLLADKLIELAIVKTVSDETVRTRLKKMSLSPG